MRRTIISAMGIAAVFAIATSCTMIEDNSTSTEENNRTVITAVAEAVGGGTKAHNQYSYDVLWDKGDQIYVTDGKKPIHSLFPTKVPGPIRESLLKTPRHMA